MTQPQAISGLGGIGKTAVAVEYAHRYGAEYPTARLFCRADSVASLESGYRDLAREINLPEREAQDTSVIVAAVRHWLEMNDGWLLILDNVDFSDTYAQADLRPFLPAHPCGHILITSRSQTFSGALNTRVVRLDTMAPDEAEAFLVKRITEAQGKDPSLLPEDERLAARELAKELGYLPLALEQAAAYIAAKQGDIRNYLNRFKKLSLELLEKLPETGDYPNTVRTTWEISFEAVERECPAAAEVLTFCAFLAPNAIPAELITGAANDIGPATQAFVATAEEGSEDSDELQSRYDDLLEPLTQYSLVTKDAATLTFSIHRMVQAVLRDRLVTNGKNATEALEQIVSGLGRVSPLPEFHNWGRCDRLVTHVIACADWARQAKWSTKEVANLFNQTALYYRGRYSEAEPLLKEALAICRSSLPEGHPDIATSLNNLAQFYNTQGRYSDAEPLYEEALAIFINALGPEHPNTKIVAGNYAAFLAGKQARSAEGRTTGARSWWGRFLPGGKKR